MSGVGNKGGVTGKGFMPGVSGNPSGRPKGIVALAKEHASRAFDVLAEIMEDETSPPPARITAAREILDRAYGKPLTMTADVTDKLDDMDDDALNAAIAAVRNAIATRREADGGETAPTAH